MLKHWPGHWDDQSEINSLHEAGKLNLVWDKAFHLLNWQPKWAFCEAVARTAQWYQQQLQSGADPLMLTRSDIEHYEE